MSGKTGKCCICGTFGPLTFEHVPPRKAFNDRGALESDFWDLMKGDLVERLENPEKQGKFNQKGFGKYTLCGHCNNTTGAWYAPAYVELAARLFPIVRSINTYDYVSVYISDFHFHAFLKQALTMFCSTAGPGFAEKRTEIRRYILNRESRDFPGDLAVYMALYDVHGSRASRYSGISARMDGLGSGMSSHVYAEVSYLPFNLVLSLDGWPPDKRLSDITWFRHFDVRAKNSALLSLHSLPVNTYFPADYRTLEEIKEQRTVNRARRAELEG